MQEHYDIPLDVPCNAHRTNLNALPLKTYVLYPNTCHLQQLKLMNEGQRLIYNDIMLKKILDPSKPVHLFLTGGVGIGKTFVLALLVQGLLRHYAQAARDTEEFPTTLIMVHTGKAAFKIGGTTIHLALHLPLISNS